MMKGFEPKVSCAAPRQMQSSKLEKLLSCLRCPRSLGEMEWAVGIDIEEIDKFENALKRNKRFFARTFSKGEVDYCSSKPNPATCFAGTFAAKEAVFKATNQLKHRSNRITDFEIVRSDEGTPFAKWAGPARSEKSALQISVSISHAGDYAVAMALAMIEG
jgi:phosphopantetheine--protein transferase-like protein